MTRRRPPDRSKMRGGRDTRTYWQMRLDGLWSLAKGVAGIALVIGGCVFVTRILEMAIRRP